MGPEKGAFCLGIIGVASFVRIIMCSDAGRGEEICRVESGGESGGGRPV